MMGMKERNFSPLPDLSLEELVPKEHFYRSLQMTLDLSFIRELVHLSTPAVAALLWIRLCSSSSSL